MDDLEMAGGCGCEELHVPATEIEQRAWNSAGESEGYQVPKDFYKQHIPNQPLDPQAIKESSSGY